MYQHKRTRGKHINTVGYGWANMRIRWCTSNLKVQTMNKYLKDKGEVLHYIGIAYDEPKRHQNIKSNVIHPLYDWKITENDALQYCYDKGFNWGGLYEHFDRLSCWCCPLKNNKELKCLYEYYPSLWNELKDMDNKSFNSFKDKGVQYYEDKFKKELNKNRV